MEKLPPAHQQTLRNEVDENPDVDTLKQVTAEAKYLSRYIEAAAQVQALDAADINLELALDEALRVGCLNSAADLVNQATQLEQATVKLYTAWKRMSKLSDRVYVDSGESTPHLRNLLGALQPLCSELIEVQLGTEGSSTARQIRLKMLSDQAFLDDDADEPTPAPSSRRPTAAPSAASQPTETQAGRNGAVRSPLEEEEAIEAAALKEDIDKSDDDSIGAEAIDVPSEVI
jgi:hypothetical protein